MAIDPIEIGGHVVLLQTMQVTAHQIAEILDGVVEGDPDVLIHAPGRIESGKEGTITFLAHPKYESFLYSSQASAVLVNHGFTPKEDVTPTLIRVDDVYGSIQKLLQSFDYQDSQSGHVDDTARIHPDAKLGANVTIHEFVVIEAGAKVGSNAILHANSYVGSEAEIGQECILHPGAKVMRSCKIGHFCTLHPNSVVGSDGFGFAQNENGQFTKIPQIGNVILEDHVDIGTCTVIDRATMGSTILRKGVKVDNLVQIGHNVEIGENTAIAGQAGVAGSTRIGKNCLIGGQVGFAGHLTVADNTMIGAQAGINNDIKEPGRKIIGSPAMDYSSFWRMNATQKRLPDMARQLRRLEKEVEALTEQIQNLTSS